MADREKESGISPEIERLSAQLARDPNSKLFIPLAEEYLKAGMVEEAVMTLEEGLKVHPAYMSARVLLGKAQFQKGDLDKAREQFEAVVKAVPDNLFAHKKLGEIYATQGMIAEALKSFKMIALFNPKDEEIAGIVSELAAGRVPEALAPRTVAPSEPPPPEEAEPAAAARELDAPLAEEEEEEVEGRSPVYVLDEEPEAGPVGEFEAPEEVLELEPVQPEMAVEAAPEEFAGVSLPEPPEAEPSPFELVEDVPLPEASPRPSGYSVDVSAEPDLGGMFEVEAEGEPSGPGGKVYELEEPSGFDMEGLDMGRVEDVSGLGSEEHPFELAEEAEPEAEPEVLEAEHPFGVAEEAAEEAVRPFEFELAEAVPEEPEPELAVEPEPEPVGEAQAREHFKTDTLAEMYITQGFYDRAINIYKTMLAERPDDKALRQKLDDVYMLASVSSQKAASRAVEKEKAAKAEQAYEPASFEEPEPALDVFGTVQLGVGPHEAVMEAETLGPPAGGYDEGAVSRLEQLLDGIRKRGMR